VEAVKKLWEAASNIDTDLKKQWIFTSTKPNKF
jgi:hypothetical protein